MRRALFVIAMVVAFSSLADVASAKTETTSVGNVTATFSYEGEGGGFKFSNRRVTITRAGQKIYDQPVVLKGCGEFCGPAADGPSGESIFIRDLDGNGELEVLVDVFTGGAHCCSYTQIHSFVPATNSYATLTEAWGNGTYRLEDLLGNGSLLFVTRDDGFAFAFTAYAVSGYPIKILQYTAGKLLNVTNGYSKEIEANAAFWLKRYKKMRKRREDVRGVLAAYVADQYLLKRPNTGWRVVRAAIRNGALRKHKGEFGPHGLKFKKTLRSFLLGAGYGRGLP